MTSHETQEYWYNYSKFILIIHNRMSMIHELSFSILLLYTTLLQKYMYFKWPSLLKLSGTYFHLSFHHISIVISPIIPGNPSNKFLTCLVVLTVEVGVVTVVIPPSTFQLHSAFAATPSIIVFVFSGELHSVLIIKRITSIT